MAAPLDTALCAVLGVLLPAAAASAASLPVVLAHSRWMAASVERALRRAASGDGDGGDGWAAVVSGCSALVEVFGKVPSLDTSEHGAGAAAAAAAAAALLAGAGAASMKAVDSEALSEGVGAAADRCERLQRALLLLLTKRAHGAARLRWSQRALLDALTALRSMPAVQLPAAAAIASLSPLIGARSSPVRFGALALFERLQSAEAEAGAAAASEEGAEEEGDADEPLPLRFLFGGAAQTVAGRRAAADGEAMVALDRLEELMGDAADAEARMLAWSAALALLAHARPTAAARVSAGWKHSGLPGFLNETLLPLLPLPRPPAPRLRSRISGGAHIARRERPAARRSRGGGGGVCSPAVEGAGARSPLVHLGALARGACRGGALHGAARHAGAAAARGGGDLRRA